MKLDLSNKRFGDLTAIKPIGKKHTQIVWQCQCDCGNLTECEATRLRRGKKNRVDVERLVKSIIIGRDIKESAAISGEESSAVQKLEILLYLLLHSKHGNCSRNNVGDVH